MIERTAKLVVGWLNARGVIDEAQSDVYVYGADILIYTLVSTAGLLVAGALFHRFWETVLIVTLYYINQTIGGGFHASTHLRCFLTMLIGLILSLLTYYLPIVYWVYYLSFMFSAFILIVIPLILHSNKKYLEGNRTFYIKRSRIIVAIQSLAFPILLIVGNDTYTHAYCLGLFASFISRLSGFFSPEDKR